MILTNKQEQGLKIAVERYKHGEPYTCIAGYAGVGKSTLIKFIISALDLPQDDVCYIAYTGKAAQVLRRKNCPNAMTAHRLLYKTIRKKDGSFVHIPHDIIYPYKLIVVDEISMLPKKMWELLLSHRRPVIALGDPGQLPPIGDDSCDVLQKPHIFLDEVMRQAAESEIIRLTMDIRDKKPLNLMRGNEVRVVDRSEILQPGFFTWADQIICGKNATRHDVNQTVRNLTLGIDIGDTEPVIGDKLICLHNEWQSINDTGDALVNGATGTLTKLKYTNENPFMQKTPIIDFQPDWDDAGAFKDLMIDYSLLTTHEPLIYKGNGNYSRIPKIWHPKEFDYGYAVTCHKSQGSEYDKVIVLEEYMKSDTPDSHSRWLYTAATRAAQKLIIVRRY